MRGENLNNKISPTCAVGMIQDTAQRKISIALQTVTLKANIYEIFMSRENNWSIFIQSKLVVVFVFDGFEREI